ncbi:damage-inducible protein J [Lactobacillus koreensis] [Lactiplantibacillus mudanjiangensis]|uniref:type II toxin-antitoxin system RelB/DinJ family antitoxin n=1 Tax=Lactiplantibacillus mudanjiangensis TaxID=1296538 RepID=UPI00101428C3|nr:type II toxin-antitoxin system RelB/DinJ family antitoxin [Lactiplantibacillus mudanjiangensis]VDG32763.1 damage-inducible protein J [Lactobacillus koreensis] [Lactiplantibacillus mudanjiangensis]
MSNIGKKVTISAEVTLTEKQRAMELFDDLGLDLSTAINIFIKKSIAEGGLPFEIEDPFYSKANQEELNRRFKKITGD